MNLVFIFLLSIILLVYVLKPLLQKKYKLVYVPFLKINEKDNLVKKKDEVLAALKEIDFEYQLGKLSEQDYQELKKEYEINALKILKQLDSKNNGNSKNDLIEEEIKAYRFKKTEAHSETQKEFKYCTQCGTKADINFKFCNNCGNPFTK